jgi:hypothetical protein
MPAAVNQVQFSTQIALRIRQLAKQISDSAEELNTLQSKRANSDFDFAGVDFSTTPGMGFIDAAKLDNALAAAQTLNGGGDLQQIRAVSAAE